MCVQDIVEDAQTASDMEKGLLRNDSTLRSLYTDILTSITGTITGLPSDADSLLDIGISFGTITSGTVATLQITDEAALRAVIDDDVSKLHDVFANSSDNGVADFIESTMLTYTQLTRGLININQE